MVILPKAINNSPSETQLIEKIVTSSSVGMAGPTITILPIYNYGETHKVRVWSLQYSKFEACYRKQVTPPSLHW